VKGERPLAAAGVVLPRGLRWQQMTNGQRAGVAIRGAGQFVLLVAALRDLRRRPAEQIRGPKAVWAVVSAVNYLGLGPIAYFLFARRSGTSLGSASGEPRSATTIGA